MIRLGQHALRIRGISTLGKRALSSSVRPGFRGSHFLAGVAGGAVLAGAGYGYYHFSGIKAKVDAAQKVSTYFRETTRLVGAQGATHANRAIESLRQFTKASVGAIPGAGVLVDVAFDSVDRVVKAHGEEATKIAAEAFTDIHAALSKLQRGKNDVEVAMNVMDVMGARLGQLHALGIKAGTTHFNEIVIKYPQLSAALGDGYAELSELAKRSPSHVHKLFDDTKNHVNSLLSQVPTEEAMQKGRDIVAQATRHARQKITDVIGKDKDKGSDAGGKL